MPFLDHREYQEPPDEDEPRQVRCNRCGSTDVRWRQQGGRWVMFSLQPGVVHECPGRSASADEFEVV